MVGRKLWVPEQVNKHPAEPCNAPPHQPHPLGLCVSKEGREPLALWESGSLGNNANIISDIRMDLCSFLAAFGEDLCFLMRSLGAGTVLEATPHIVGDASGTAGHCRVRGKGGSQPWHAPA